MKKVRQGDHEDIGTSLIRHIEEQTEKSVFTIRVKDSEEEEALETLVVFEDKSILMGVITVQEVDGEIAARIQGNFV